MNPVAVLPLGVALLLTLFLGRPAGSGRASVGDRAILLPEIVRARAAAAIERAGLSGSHSPERLSVLAVLCAGAGGLLGFVAGGGGLAVFLSPALAIAGFAIPFRLVSVHAARRRDQVLRELPDLLDLLAICVGTGMALDPALRLATERFPGVVSQEFAALFAQLDLGARRDDAYRDFARRLGTPEAGALSAALIQADALGLPLAATLGEQSEAMLVRREQAAREHAAKAAPRVQLVVALVVVPGAMVLILGALVLELIDQLSGFGALG